MYEEHLNKLVLCYFEMFRSILVFFPMHEQ